MALLYSKINREDNRVIKDYHELSANETKTQDDFLNQRRKYWREVKLAEETCPDPKPKPRKNIEKDNKPKDEVTAESLSLFIPAIATENDDISIYKIVKGILVVLVGIVFFLLFGWICVNGGE